MISVICEISEGNIKQLLTMWKTPSLWVASHVGAVRTLTTNCMTFSSISLRLRHTDSTNPWAAVTGETKSS